MATQEPAAPVPAVAGLMSVAAMVVAFLLLPGDDGATTPTAVADHYAGHADAYLRAGLLQVGSLGLLLVLVGGLAVRLRAEGAALAATLVGLGGGLLVTCQVLGYGLIVTLAQSVAPLDDAVARAWYDLSALPFTASYVGLAVLGGAVAAASWTGIRRRPVLAGFTALVTAAAVVAATGYAANGTFALHGDLGFLAAALQLVWTLVVAVSLLRPALRTVRTPAAP